MCQGAKGIPCKLKAIVNLSKFDHEYGTNDSICLVLVSATKSVQGQMFTNYVWILKLKAAVPPAAHLFCACINLKRLGELFQVSNFNMASNAGGAHGGARRNSGRKKAFSSRKDYRKSWESHRKRIYLNVNIFNSWKEAKIEAGYSNSSDSDFAAHLLSLELRRK